MIATTRPVTRELCGAGLIPRIVVVPVPRAVAVPVVRAMSVPAVRSVAVPVMQSRLW